MFIFCAPTITLLAARGQVEIHFSRSSAGRRRCHSSHYSIDQSAPSEIYRGET
uniref:Uncharacterized protein n=1 Tax=Anguilla anguilla TaxID=7936 RepID=A0A0E9PJK8_ANGAN